MKKVFLKFNRSDASALLCLSYWLELFKNYEIIILCDLFPDTGLTPKWMDPVLLGKIFTVKNSDYTLRYRVEHLFTKKTKLNQACANLTCFNLLTIQDDNFWLIDADDTMFLHRDFDLIRIKLKIVEDRLVEEDLDGLSLDFYREIKEDHWSFGVAFLASRINLDLLSNANLFKKQAIKNLDHAFDNLRISNQYKLKSFVIDDCGFQHLINFCQEVPGGIYYWKNKQLWNTPLASDIIIL
jgi:hypothetical protein